MATESDVINGLLAQHPNYREAVTDGPWESIPPFSTQQKKTIHIHTRVGASGSQKVTYELVRTVGDSNSVVAQGSALATDSDKVRSVLFREKVAQLAANFFLDAGGNGHRGVRLMQEYDSPSGWLEIMPLATEIPFYRFVWLQANNSLGFSSPVTLASMPAHLLK